MKNIRTTLLLVTLCLVQAHNASAMLASAGRGVIRPVFRSLSTTVPGAGSELIKMVKIFLDAMPVASQAVPVVSQAVPVVSSYFNRVALALAKGVGLGGLLGGAWVATKNDPSIMQTSMQTCSAAIGSARSAVNRGIERIAARQVPVARPVGASSTHAVSSALKTLAKWGAISAVVAGGAVLAYSAWQKYKRHGEKKGNSLESLEGKYSSPDSALGDARTTCYACGDWRDRQYAYDTKHWPHAEDLMPSSDTRAHESTQVYTTLIADIRANKAVHGYRLVITDIDGNEIQNPTWQDFFDMIIQERSEIEVDKMTLKKLWPAVETEYQSVCSALGVPGDNPARWTAENKKQVKEGLEAKAQGLFGRVVCGQENQVLRSAKLWWVLVQRYWRLHALEQVVRENILIAAGIAYDRQVTESQATRILGARIGEQLQATPSFLAFDRAQAPASAAGSPRVPAAGSSEAGSASGDLSQED